ARSIRIGIVKRCSAANVCAGAFAPLDFANQPAARYRITNAAIHARIAGYARTLYERLNQITNVRSVGTPPRKWSHSGPRVAAMIASPAARKKRNPNSTL